MSLMRCPRNDSFVLLFCFFFFFNDTATTEIYTLSLHDALPIFRHADAVHCGRAWQWLRRGRSEEHTSELQSHVNLVCRLLLEKKNTKLIARQLDSKKVNKRDDNSKCVAL